MSIPKLGSLLALLLFVAPASAGEHLLGVLHGSARGDSTVFGPIETNGIQYIETASLNAKEIQLRKQKFAYRSRWQTFNPYEEVIDYWSLFSHGWHHVDNQTYAGTLNNSTVTDTPPGAFYNTTGYGFDWPIPVWVSHTGDLSAWQTCDETGLHPMEYIGYYSHSFVQDGSFAFENMVTTLHYFNLWNSSMDVEVWEID
jgi:hypothetical protein